MVKTEGDSRSKIKLNNETKTKNEKKSRNGLSRVSSNHRQSVKRKRDINSCFYTDFITKQGKNTGKVRKTDFAGTPLRISNYLKLSEIVASKLRYKKYISVMKHRKTDFPNSYQYRKAVNPERDSRNNTFIR